MESLINGATALALYFKKNKKAGYEKVWPVFHKYLPLLEEVELEDKDRFYFARDLLIKKNKLVKD